MTLIIDNNLFPRVCVCTLTEALLPELSIRVQRLLLFLWNRAVHGPWIQSNYRALHLPDLSQPSML